MAKALTKAQLAARLAQKTGLSEKSVVQLLDELSVIATKEAKNTFTLPGLGKLALVNRRARMGRDPRTGERVRIPARKEIKFRVTKAARDVMLPAPKKER